MTEGLQEFARRYDMSLNDPLLNDMYEYELSAKRDYASAMSQAEDKGSKNGQIRMIHKLLANGASKDLIYMSSDLPRSEIDAILAQQE